MATAPSAATPATTSPRTRVSPLAIFLTFLLVGATSFGGGVIAYLRDALVRNKQWFDDVEFLEMTSISNTLPGLNATNMAILAGDRLAGWLGAAAALIGMCLPAFLFMVGAGIVYAEHHARPLAAAALRGVAAAATGLIAATWYKIGKKSLRGFYDAFFVMAAILGINYFKWGVPITLLAVGAVAIFTYRPHTEPEKPAQEQEEWIRSLH
ncbi:MAG: chromate transporter [Candidatus Eremiobacteraeota bacterium]|nr:chromate transporter [Candidatus Eremiobacteraeota bacterium]